MTSLIDAPTMNRTARVAAIALSLALAGVPSLALAQVSVPPAPPGQIGPTPTNPGDTGQGTTQGTNPTGQPTPLTPVGPSTGTMGPTIMPSTGVGVPAYGTGLPSTVTSSGLPSAIAGRAPLLLRDAPPPSRAELPEAIRPRPGGLTAEGAAVRAVRTSYGVQAAQAGVRAAEAQRAETALQMLPNISASMRYTRLSEFQAGTIPAFNTVECIRAENFARCQANPLQFQQNVVLQQPILDQYAFRATVTVPLSDIPLRMARYYEAAGLTAEARRIEVEGARMNAAQQARETFYEYIRAVGSSAAAAQGLEAARMHQTDVQNMLNAGLIARVELFAANAQVAERERMVLLAANNASVQEALLRQRLHMSASESVGIGEAVDAPAEIPPNPVALVERAMRDRPEVQALNRQVRALDANIAGTRAAYFPSVAASGNFDYANPNSRIFPQTQQFQATWDATLQLAWNPSAALVAGATVDRLQAQRAQLVAQYNSTREAVDLEVRQIWSFARTAEANIASARAQLATAEESYRVRRERFRAGASTFTELTDAEVQLLSSRIAVIDAYANLRIFASRLRRATGVRESGR